MRLRGEQKDRTPLLITAVVLGGAGALLASFLLLPPSFDAHSVRRLLALVAVTAAAELVSIRLQHGNSAELITLFELAVVADIVLLPPTLAAIAAVGGLAAALALQRRAPIKAAFNLGGYSLGVVAAISIYESLGQGRFDTGRGLISITVGMTAFAAVNLLTISAIIAAKDRRPLAKVLVEERGLSIAMGLGNSAVGVVAVALYLTRVALLPAVLAPALALHLAFRGWVKQKELSRRMEEEKIKLERVVEHSSEGIVLADHSGAVMLWSPSMERITGVPVAEALGRALPFLLRGRGHQGQSVKVGVSADATPFELEIVTPSGLQRWLRVQHGPSLDRDGSLAFDVLVVNDVTREREVARLKDDFIMTVSHELRTPLTPIKGYASLLLRRGDDVPPERRKEALQSIVERADHMARLVEDLLLASRVTRDGERRLPEVQRQSVDLVRVVDKALSSFKLAQPHRDFRVQAPEALAALGDPMRVEQVVAHLVSNAIKFSDQGTPVDVTLSTDGARARIDVRDEGRGIPADKLDEIFEKFKRLEDPMRMETGGAGLGLYIVRELVAAMGGEVGVTSEVGRGSTFSVWLPAGEASGAVGDARAAGG